MSPRILLLLITLPAASAGIACGGSTGSLPGDASPPSEAGSGDAGDGGAPQDAQVLDAAIECDGSTCKQGEVCVVTMSSGGACLLADDAGVCPDGMHTTPGTCCSNASVGYACQPLPPACHGVLACPCASTLCQCGGCQVGAPGTLSCSCEYP